MKTGYFWFKQAQYWLNRAKEHRDNELRVFMHRCALQYRVNIARALNNWEEESRLVDLSDKACEDCMSVK